MTHKEFDDACEKFHCAEGALWAIVDDHHRCAEALAQIENMREAFCVFKRELLLKTTENTNA
jgi:hypothetical protein